MPHTCLVAAFSPSCVWGEGLPLALWEPPKPSPPLPSPVPRLVQRMLPRVLSLVEVVQGRRDRSRFVHRAASWGDEKPSPSLPLTGWDSVAPSASCYVLSLFWGLLFTPGTTRCVSNKFLFCSVNQSSCFL